MILYPEGMKVTATEFRKNAFVLLEKALQGEIVEIVYKGSTLKLSPIRQASKLARAKRQHALLCDPEAIVHSDPRLLAELEAEWRKEWRKL